MQYEYDSEADGLYIWFMDDIEENKTDYAGEIWPNELKNEIGLIFAKDGKLMGLEIQPASKYFDAKKLNNF